MLRGKRSRGWTSCWPRHSKNLGAPELDCLAGRVTEVLLTRKPRVELGSRVRPLYKKGDHLRQGNWRPIC